MPSLLFNKLHTRGAYRGSSTKASDRVLKHKQFPPNVVDNHGNMYVYKLYVTAQHFKFATYMLTPVTRRWIQQAYSEHDWDKPIDGNYL